MKVQVIQGAIHRTSPNYVASMAMLEHCNLQSQIVADTKQLMTLTKGCCSPEYGFAIMVGNGHAPILDCIQLAKWIETHGLKPI